MPTQSVLRPGAPRGFSLVELLLALMVAGVVLTLVVPRMGGIINLVRSTSAADRLSGDLALARMQAVREGRTVLVRFAGGSAYHVTLDNGSTATDTLKSVDLSSDYRGVTLSPDTGRIAFDSRGLLRTGSRTITVTREGQSKKLTVTAVGRIYREN